MYVRVSCDDGTVCHVMMVHVHHVMMILYVYVCHVRYSAHAHAELILSLYMALQ